MAIVCRNLGVIRGERRVIRDFSYTFQDGCVTALVGPNGSGKSSLLKAMYAYLPIASGEVEIDGTSLNRWTPSDLASALGVCPQEAEPSLDFEVDQLLSLRYRGNREKTRTALADLAFLSLHELFQRKLSQLSGGERQRVRLGLALAHQPPWLLLDEPANHLDLSTEWSLLEYLKTRPGGVVLALHDLGQAVRFCDHLVVLDQGSVVAAGAPTEVLTEELLERVFGLSGRIELNGPRPSLSIGGVAGRD